MPILFVITQYIPVVGLPFNIHNIAQKVSFYFRDLHLLL